MLSAKPLASEMWMPSAQEELLYGLACPALLLSRVQLLDGCPKLPGHLGYPQPKEQNPTTNSGFQQTVNKHLDFDPQLSQCWF